MSLDVNNIAEQASFQAFMNCYLREVEQGGWQTAQQWRQVYQSQHERDNTTLFAIKDDAWIVELPLPHQSAKLAVEVTYRTQVGRHSFGRLFHYQAWQFLPQWSVIAPLNAVLLLVREMYVNAGYQDMAEKERELLRRILDSEQVMQRYVTARKDDERLQSLRFIDAEQALVFGHWQHPTPKSRQGMADYQHDDYAPELTGEFSLHYFQIHRSLISQRSALAITAEDMIRQSFAVGDLVTSEYLVLPMHPIQAQWLLHQDYVQALIAQRMIIDCGRRGIAMTATSSVRSLYHPELPWMYKFSIPIKITNSLRVNKRHELEAGVVMASLYRKTGFSERYPSFQVITDPAYITVDLPARAESGFEVIIRENPFPQGDDHDTVTIAALTQDPLLTSDSLLASHIKQLAERMQMSLPQTSMKWFARYWDCAIEPMIRLYDEHGIALEAHQQNSVLRFNSQGYPQTYYFRDNQGFYLSTAYATYLESLEPDSATVHDLYFDDQMICDRFAYYLMINHLFSIIGRMGADQLIAESVLLHFVQQRLMALKQELTGAGHRFVVGLLSKPSIPAKANLLTRVQDIDELMVENEQAVYTAFPNPLSSALPCSSLVGTESDVSQNNDENAVVTEPSEVTNAIA